MGWDCKLYIIYPSFHSGPAKAVVRKAHRTHSNVGSLLTLFRHKKKAPFGAVLMADGVGFEPTLDG